MPKAQTPLVMEVLPSDYPIPEKYKPRFPDRREYPFDQMEVGDKMKFNRPLATVQSAIWRWAEKHPLDGGTFVARKLDKQSTVVQKLSDKPQPARQRRKRGRPSKKATRND